MSASTSSRSDLSGAIQSFSFDDIRGEILTDLRPAEIEVEIRRLVDPGSAVATIHWGNNYIYRAMLRSRAGERSVVVKAFRNETVSQRLRRRWRGSKAERSWRSSHAFLLAGVPVPAPLALIDSRTLAGPSFFVCGYLENALEARYLFRAMNADTHSELFPEIDVDLFLQSLGRLIRRLHDADLWHRDLSPGNVLLIPRPKGEGHELHLIDLNRARLGRRLSRSERMRDLCRLPVSRESHRQQLLESYWSGERVRGRRLYLLYHHGFLAKNRYKKRLRSIPATMKKLAPRTRHVHIELPRRGTDARDRVVWDPLSDQPHQHAGRLQKLSIRLADGGGHARTAVVVLRSLPATLRRYRALREMRYARTVVWPEPGVCLGAAQPPIEELEPLLESLGTRRLLLRLQPWNGHLDAAETLARELIERGYELTFAVPQNRDLVRDPGLWRASLEEIADRFLGFSRDLEIGHAINRSKWGIWTVGEYTSMMRIADEVLRTDERVRLLGPAVIDFEFQHTAAILNSSSSELRFDVVSSLLYVDRRGAPENRQLGLDTVAKVTLLKALVETSRHGDRPCWITEVNWPLAEGPHSPAGRGVVVDEESQANFLVRYFLLTVCCGLIERVYWWQVVARGYGLVNPVDGGHVRRPSYQAFRHMRERLQGCRMISRLASEPDVFLFLFERDGSDHLVVGWANGRELEVDLPRPPRAVFSRDGARQGANGKRVRVGPSPRYFELSLV